MRRLSLRGGIVANETVLAWDEGRRFAYRVDDVNAPGVRSFMEEWTVEPSAEGKTWLRWALAVDGTKPVQLLSSLAARDWTAPSARGPAGWPPPPETAPEKRSEFVHAVDITASAVPRTILPIPDRAFRAVSITAPALGLDHVRRNQVDASPDCSSAP